MAYDWLLSPLNNTFQNISQNSIIYLIEYLIPRLVQLILTPVLQPQIFWIILPLIIATLLMLLYYGRYRNEELGWNTAFSNNIILIFVSANLIQHLSEVNALLTSKAVFVYAILLYNVVQLIMNYLHLIPKYISFIINATIPVNVIQYMAIIITYSDIPLDSATLIASGVLLAVLYGFSRILWIFVPMSKGSKIFQSLQEKKELKLKEREDRKIKRDEALNINDSKSIKYGVLGYLLLYFILFIVNKFIINLESIYLIILSAYFTIFSVFYIKKKKLCAKNLLIMGKGFKINLGVLFGVLIFFYYIIVSNFFIEVFNIKDYSTSNVMLVFNIIAASISGELFFRGVVQRGLKASYNKNISIGVQALLWSILKADFFLVTFSTIHQALIGVLIIYPLGYLLGLIKEEWCLDSAIAASFANGLLSMISIVV